MALDCVQGYNVFIMDRGGERRLAEVTQLSALDWSRKRDDISDANFTLSGDSCSDQAELLNQIEPGRHEIAIYRGDDRVWEGPITLATFTRESASFQAKDVCQYLYRTAMHNKHDNRYPNVVPATSRIATIIRQELARKEALDPPINVVPHLVVHHWPNEAQSSQYTHRYQTTVWNHMDNLAQSAGLDYTTIGRAIHLFDGSRPLGQTATVTENDFRGELVVSVYGMNLATRYIVTDGNGAYAAAGGVDDYYGEVEFVSNPYAQTTSKKLTKSALVSQAKRNLKGRNPTPVLVRIPDNSSLNPDGVLKITDLVPGVHIPLLANQTARKVQQMQKLDSMQASVTAEGEDVKVVFVPATQDDNGDDASGTIE